HVDHLEHRLRHRTRMDVGRELQRAKLPRQVARVRVELDAHGARRVDLRVPDRVGRIDVAKSGRLADLLVERHERVAEAEHRDDDDDELHDERAVAPRDGRAALLARSRAAHFHKCRPMATSRYKSTAPPTTAIDTASSVMRRDTMNPKKN